MMFEVGSKCRFTLWWRIPPVINSRGILKFDWMRLTLLSGGGERGETFFKGSSPEVKFLGQPHSLGQETWPLENSNSNKIFFPL